MKKVASNLLYDRGVLQHDPLLTLDDTGRVIAVDRVAAPDREPFTIFRAGVLVAAMPEAAFEALATWQQHPTPLPQWIESLTAQAGAGAATTWALVSGLDYPALTPTERTKIERL